MNIKSFLSSSKASLLSFGVVMAMTLGLQSCKETIDDSAFAIKTELTIADYLNENPEFSRITEIFSQTPLSPFDKGTGQASPILSALSARGNYTVFLPTNATIKAYEEDVLQHPLTSEDARLLAYSCIIDNGKNQGYETPEFPRDGGAFAIADLNDRLITCRFDNETERYIINGVSVLDNTHNHHDVRLANGYVHWIVPDSEPIAPSSKSVADLIKTAPNMKWFSMLLEKTRWDSIMSVDLVDVDQDYEAENHDLHITIPNMSTFNIVQHRYLGFTGFVETDEVFASELGLSADADDATFMAAITAKAQSVYGAEDQDDLTSEDNAVNRFVAYHFLDAKVAYNKLVRHINEYGYGFGTNQKNPQTDNLSVDVWDYYVTVGSHRGLLKVSQDGEAGRDKSHGIYLNRVSKYDTQNYSVLYNVADGVRIFAENTVGDETYDNNAKNGFYYPINKILFNDAETQNVLASERIRFDVTTILPELLSNNVRGGVYTHFPNGYFENITNESSATKLLYLNAAAVGSTAWIDYQDDEFMASGLFDFILKLPPVPASGTYELRMAVNHNTLRGMAQLYLGENPYNLQPLGLPYDMRQKMINNSEIGYVDDEGLSEDQMLENDKVMRTHGYMKAPRYYSSPDGAGNGVSARKLRSDVSGAMRKILTTQYFDKNKTYYIRFKSALEKTDSQFWIDYFEFVPSIIYNGTEAEDQW